MDDKELLGTLAMKKFLESRLDEVHIEQNFAGLKVKVAGDTYGLLGASAIILQNALSSNPSMPLKAALGFIEAIVPVLMDGRNMDEVDCENLSDQKADLMEQFKNLMNNKSTKKSKRKNKEDK